MSQVENREGIMSTELSEKPDAMKVARPVWGCGRGEIPLPTPPVDAQRLVVFL